MESWWRVNNDEIHVVFVKNFFSFLFFFMPPTSEKLRGHIGLGLSVRLSITLWQLRNSRTPYARILKLYMWHVHEK